MRHRTKVAMIVGVDGLPLLVFDSDALEGYACAGDTIRLYGAVWLRPGVAELHPTGEFGLLRLHCDLGPLTPAEVLAFPIPGVRVSREASCGRVLVVTPP